MLLGDKIETKSNLSAGLIAYKSVKPLRERAKICWVTVKKDFFSFVFPKDNKVFERCNSIGSSTINKGIVIADGIGIGGIECQTKCYLSGIANSAARYHKSGRRLAFSWTQ